MKIINYFSSCAIPMIILIIVFYGIYEKQKVFDDFVDGAQEGIKTTFKILPTLIGLFISIGALRNSGVLDFIINLINPITSILQFPKEVLPLAILRPLSGSASIAIANDIFSVYGVDSFVGLVSSIIMGSTETTFYIVAIYTSCVGIKNIRFVLIPALIADFIVIATSVVVCHILL